MNCINLAFDKVPHKWLLWKFEQDGGLKGKPLNWMEDLLKDREMRTIIRDKNHPGRRVLSRVLQGLVLASITFPVYMNYISEIKDSYISLFADDTELMRRMKNKEDCEVLQDLAKILEWSWT